MASKKRGKKKRSEIQELSEFIRDHMVTKDNLKDALEPMQKTLDEHTRDLDMIKNDVKTNLDKRLTLEVRVANIEKKSLRRFTRTHAPVINDFPAPANDNLPLHLLSATETEATSSAQ